MKKISSFSFVWKTYENVLHKKVEYSSSKNSVRIFKKIFFNSFLTVIISFLKIFSEKIPKISENFPTKNKDPKTRQIIQRKYRSQMADQICYAVLCVFSYIAAGLEQHKRQQQQQQQLQLPHQHHSHHQQQQQYGKMDSKNLINIKQQQPLSSASTTTTSSSSTSTVISAILVPTSQQQQ